jgi:hypothetical protein
MWKNYEMRIFMICFQTPLLVHSSLRVRDQISHPYWTIIYYIFFPLWLYSPWRTLAASHIGGVLELFRHMVGLLGRVISPSQGLYLHRTTQHRKTRYKHPCLERDSNPRSQQLTGQDPHLWPHGHCDRLLYILTNTNIFEYLYNLYEI